MEEKTTDCDETQFIHICELNDESCSITVHQQEKAICISATFKVVKKEKKSILEILKYRIRFIKCISNLSFNSFNNSKTIKWIHPI